MEFQLVSTDVSNLLSSEILIKGTCRSPKLCKIVQEEDAVGDPLLQPLWRSWQRMGRRTRRVYY